MFGRPDSTEADPYLFNYIDLVKDEATTVMQTQLAVLPQFLGDIGSEKSLTRYAPGKWSIREVLSHMTDTERVFSFRALWFARGFDSALPSFDQDTGVTGAAADKIGWDEHIEEFLRVRLATISLFNHLPEQAWSKTGIASSKTISVRALAYIIAGHVEHHVAILKQRYL